ncbi:MAG: hypothetical protein BJ554DRAFT_701 [Olpidium bornovanus]|uniref:DUF423-domain-containing protein n=1 Tax=Olpidium bornovanus TaxID=278681 RepID=A0A8H8DHP4_9FUNG|nr:MAG: hypothetical protein BJ554DRAFT_701 [Olpidium bornovanus]
MLLGNANLWRAGCLLGATAILTGAFGSHGLKARLGPKADPSRIEAWKTAAHYQLVHAVATCVAVSAKRSPLAGSLFVAGSILFSGSIYALVWGQDKYRFLGPVTPLGGVALIGGWLAMLL